MFNNDDIKTANSEPAKFILKALRYDQENLKENESDFLINFSNFLKDNQLDIFKISKLAIEQGTDVFRTVYFLSKQTDQYTNFNEKTLIEFLVLITEKMKNDYAGNSFYNSFEKLIATDLTKANKLIDIILDNKIDTLYGYLNILIIHLIQVDETKGYSIVSQCLNSKDDLLKGNCGIRILGLIPKIDSVFYKNQLNNLFENIKSENTALAANSAFAICKLSINDNTLIQELLKLEIITPNALYEIFQHIWLTKGDLLQWHKTIILKFANYDLKHLGITDKIDWILFNLAHSNKEIDFVYEYLNTWVSKHSNEELNQFPMDVCFKISIFEMIKIDDLNVKLIFNWLNSDEFKYHICAAQYLNYATNHGMKAPNLESDILKKLSTNDAIYIIRKTLGFVFDFNLSASIIFSLLKSMSASMDNLFIEVFSSILGKDYPHQTISFLNLKKDAFQSTISLKKESIEASIKIIEYSIEKYNSLKIAPELISPNEIKNEHFLNFQMQVNESFKEARKKSIFGQFGNVEINEGRGHFSYYQGKFSNIAYLSTLSHEFNIPRNELVNAVHAKYRRIQFRHAVRGEK